MYRTGSNSGAGAKLFIESVDSDNSTPLIHAIGGKYYTDILAGSTAELLPTF